MKTTHILVTLTFALIATFGLTGCGSTGGGSGSGTHQMGSPKSGYTMSNQNMPGR